MENQNTEKLPNYGRMLIQSISEKFSGNPSDKPSDFERFVLGRGYLFESDEALKAGYDRYWKAEHNILITADEFIAEAELGVAPFSEELREATKEAYEILVEFARKGILVGIDVYEYARNRWCLDNPKTIESWQVGPSHYIVNNCSTKISEDEAKIKINAEWGFEASRIVVIGTPYYESTDWQFIRFNCCGVGWLWVEESLYKVY